MTRVAERRLLSLLPEPARPYVGELLAAHPIDVRLSRPRRTRLGDHRGPGPSQPRHRISVNEDLNPFAFLTTLLHEIAHALAWERHRARATRLRPHGRQWRREFAAVLTPVIRQRMVPPDVAAALSRSLHSPAAATCTDRGLVLALSKYDVPSVHVFVESLAEGTVFQIDAGRYFRLGRRLRSRYQCFEQRTGREFRLHGLCRVVPISDRG